MNIVNIEQLLQWLNKHEIDISIWRGSIGNKSVADLWQEIESGEAYLEDDPPLRVVNVVRMIVQDGSRVLKVLSWNLLGIATKDQKTYPSETIKPKETPIAAALRGLQEELGLRESDLHVLDHSKESRSEVRESSSYPGLKTRYKIYTVRVKVSNLPKDDFVTYERVEDSNKVIRHNWCWVEQDIPRL